MPVSGRFAPEAVSRKSTLGVKRIARRALTRRRLPLNIDVDERVLFDRGGKVIGQRRFPPDQVEI